MYIYIIFAALNIDKPNATLAAQAILELTAIVVSN